MQSILRRVFHVVVLVWLVPSPALLRAASPPNILWISIEDYSPDFGCYGSTYARTPHVDSLAAAGARFTRAFSVAPVCAPSRSSIITGMYASSIGTQWMRCKAVPPPHVKCFTEYLRAAGYFCSNDSKTDYNFDSPRTAWDESRPGAHWRNRRRPDQPFFAVINLTRCHESQIRQPEKQWEKMIQSMPPGHVHDPDLAKLPPYYPDTPVVRRDWARYHDVGSATDAMVGRILQDLADDGLADSTIVFFWADHGRGLPRGKRWLYDSGTHVPLIVRWPGKIEPGEVRDELVSLLDLAPTVLSLAQVKVPDHFQGRDFLGPDRGPEREYVYGIRDRMDETPDMMRSVRDKRFHYIRNYRPELPYAQQIAYMDEMPTMQQWRKLAAEDKLTGPQKLFFATRKPPEELYDTVADPHEINNLAGDPAHGETLARLRAAHEKWVRDTSDIGQVDEKEYMERVRPGGKWSETAAPEITIRRDIMTLRSPTEGASLAWSPEEKGKDNWLLYTGPVKIPEDQRIRAQAFRLGFKDSEIQFAP